MILDAVGINGFQSYVDSLGPNARLAATLAVNDSARYGHSVLKKDMMRRVNLTSKYIGSARDGRMRIGKYASKNEDDPNANLIAQRRGTMLYRFVQNQSEVLKHKSGRPAKVMVRPGSIKAIERAFAMRMRGGNIGLVKRISTGPNDDPMHMRKSKGAKRIGRGLFLLYGPSVSQIMEETISKNTYIQSDISLHLSNEFTRQIARLNNGR